MAAAVVVVVAAAPVVVVLEKPEDVDHEYVLVAGEVTPETARLPSDSLEVSIPEPKTTARHRERLRASILLTLTMQCALFIGLHRQTRALRSGEFISQMAAT